MSRQNIASPRAFLNIPEYLASTGLAIHKMYRTLPVIPNTLLTETTYTVPNSNKINYTNKYIAFLGHTFGSNEITLNPEEDEGPPGRNGSTTFTPIINGTNGSFRNGFSILSTNESNITFHLNNNTSVSSIVAGTYYDFNSPDLNLSLEYDYSGVKEITTKGGSTLTNAYYLGPPNWGSLGAWELGGSNFSNLSKKSRRIWRLKWSHLADTSVFPTYASLTNENLSQDGSETTLNTLLQDDSFQRLITFTNGGQIPFLFCSNGDDIRQDNLAIAKFDMKSFKFTQTAFNTYTTSCKIKEIW